MAHHTRFFDDQGPHWFRRRIFAAVVIAVFGFVAVSLTEALLTLDAFHGLQRYKHLITSGELVLFGIASVETVARAIRRRYITEAARPEVRQRDLAFRAVLRMVVYGGIGVAIVSLLAQNTALAISVGSFTGVLIGFAAQSTLGNVFAGMVIAIAHPFTVGDEVTVKGFSGRVIDVGPMFTRLENADSYTLIPNNALLSEVMQRRKPGR